MIIDNVKERLDKASEEIDFIKECLWRRGRKKRTWTVKRKATSRRFLFRPKKSAWGWKKD